MIFALICVCLAIVAPQFEYRGRIPGSVVGVKNTESFVTDLTNRVTQLERFDPSVITGAVRMVNNVLPSDNGEVKINVGVQKINGQNPMEGGDFALTTDGESYTNAMMAFRSAVGVIQSQSVYFDDASGLLEYTIRPPQGTIAGKSKIYWLVVKTDINTQIRFNGFGEVGLLVDDDWQRYMTPGVTAFRIVEYQQGKYKVNQYAKALYREAMEGVPLHFTAAQANVTISMVPFSSTAVKDLEMTRDLIVWETFTPGSSSVTLANIGDSVYFRCKNTSESAVLARFSLRGKVYCDGNIQSLLFHSAPYGQAVGEAAFYRLFYQCTNLLSCPILPATSLAEECYSSMFEGCTGITEAPNLPSTALADYCYPNMFRDCTSLKHTPSLPARVLSPGCYVGMFAGCIGITNAVPLLATTVPQESYASMFQGCTSLVEAPMMSCTTINDGGCTAMFSGCSSLNFVRVAFHSWQNTTLWMEGVGNSGIFRCPSDLPVETRGVSTIPVGWTVVTE